MLQKGQLLNKFGGKTTTNALQPNKVIKAPKPVTADDDDDGELEIDFGPSKQ